MATRTAPSQCLIGQRKLALDTPALLVDLDVMEVNIARIVAACRAHGVAWRPHSKAHKTPEIAELQIAAGAIGITCAKLSEAEVMAKIGPNQTLYFSGELPAIARAIVDNQSWLKLETSIGPVFVVERGLRPLDVAADSAAPTDKN